MDEDKKAKMIEAALEEFALHGFRKANTNNIVSKAGTSKGLLFHYFGSKKELYLYLYDYAMEIIVKEFIDIFEWDEKDIFKRWRNATKMKLDLMKKYGNLFEFILQAYVNTPEEVKDNIDKQTMDWVVSTWDVILKDIDTTYFKYNIDVEKAVQIIYWTIDGYSNKKLDPQKHLDYYTDTYEELMDELEEYMVFLKKLFYKPERQ